MEGDVEQTEQAEAENRFEVKWTKRNEPKAPPSETVTVGESEDVAELRRQLEAEKQRSQDLSDRWHRAAADLVNLRKRTEQEQAEKEKFASMMLVFELLPILDNFERAVATIPGNLAMLTWLQGVVLIQRQLQAILERQGLAPIEAEGQPFNPSLHEAIAERETADVAPGTVVQEYQRGYTMHGRVIRPTLVEVAGAPAAVQRQPEEAEVTEPVDSDGTFVADPEAVEEEIQTDVPEEAQSENTGP